MASTHVFENRMVMPSAAPPESRHDHLEPERTETCAACKKTGCLVSDGWYTDTSVEDDEDGPYLAGGGETLRDAEDTPSGWVCSNACRSQAMYASASVSERLALDRTLDACLTIAEYAAHANPVVKRYFDGHLTGLIAKVNDFLGEIEHDKTPDWCNRLTREEALERALKAAEERR